MSPPPLETSPERPGRVVVWVWTAAVVLSLYGAADVQTWLRDSSFWGERAFALAAADALADAGAATGLSLLRRAVEGGGQTRGPADAAPDLPRPPPAAPLPAGTPAPARRISRVLLVGASTIQFHLGAELERRMTSYYEGLTVHRLGKLSTGLARPDVFDWPARLRTLVAEHHPDLVLANFGGNDAQSMVLDDGRPARFGRPEWEAAYLGRVRRVVEIGRAGGAEVVMLGMSTTRDPALSRRTARINGLTETATIAAGGRYLPAWDIGADAQGQFQDVFTVDGVPVKTRLADGKHFSQAGAAFVADKVLQRLERFVELTPARKDLAVARRINLTSAALGRPSSFLAYVPQDAPATRFPVLYLLHGAQGGWTDWPEHAHRELQALAHQHRLVVVTPEGGEGGWYLDSALLPGSNHESHLIAEVLPAADRVLPVSSLRGIAGLSMGGHGAITLALKHPALFKSVSSMSGVLDLTAARDRPALIARLGPYEGNESLWQASSANDLITTRLDVARTLPLLITVGSSDRWAPVNRAFHQQLTRLEILHTFEETPGAHNWTYWTAQLERHVRWHAERLR